MGLYNRLLEFQKFLSSFTKGSWELTDYPIAFRQTDVGTWHLPEDRFKLIPWTAGITNWPRMTAHGDSKLLALKALQEKLESFREGGALLPRPGTKVPEAFRYIDIASSERAERLDDIAADFFRKIFDMGRDEYWISDESTLGDFHFELSDEEYVIRIRELYDVDVSDIEKGNIVAILERIQGTRVRT